MALLMLLGMRLFDIFVPINDAACCARECNVLWVKGIYKKRDAPRRIPLLYGLVGVLQLDGVHYEAVGGNFHGHFLAYLHIFLYRADGVLVVVVLVVQAAAQDCLYGIGLN